MQFLQIPNDAPWHGREIARAAMTDPDRPNAGGYSGFNVVMPIADHHRVGRFHAKPLAGQSQGFRTWLGGGIVARDEDFNLQTVPGKNRANAASTVAGD